MPITEAIFDFDLEDIWLKTADLKKKYEKKFSQLSFDSFDDNWWWLCWMAGKCKLISKKNNKLYI